jgi:hypothetical protein
MLTYGDLSDIEHLGDGFARPHRSKKLQLTIAIRISLAQQVSGDGGAVCWLDRNAVRRMSPSWSMAIEGCQCGALTRWP